MSAFASLQRKRESSSATPALKSKAANTHKALPRREAPSLQPKLSLGEVDDAHEREADAIADAIMKNDGERRSIGVSARPTPDVQRKCACDEEQLRRKPLIARGEPALPTNAAGDRSVPSPLASRLRAHHGRGAALPADTRASMERSLHVDLGDVRIHDDAAAHELSTELGAQAFTTGRDIYFNRGRYSPNDGVGRRLLAHELVHVVQQGSGGARAIQRKVDEVLLNCADRQIHFQHDGETTSYALDHCDVPNGEFDASVKLASARVDFTLNDLPPGTPFDFHYSIAPGQPTPNTFFAGQTAVKIRVSHVAGQAPGAGVRFNVRSLSADEFQQMTGSSIAWLPERVFVAASSLLLSSEATPDSTPSSIGPIGAGALFTPTPLSFIPPNSTGVLWTGGHLSIFSNPETALLPTLRGYRGNFGYYAQEMVFGDRVTVTLHEGVPGSFANDVGFPLNPGEQNYLYVARNAEEASAFAQRLQQTRYGGEYTYSPPRPPGSPSDPILDAPGRGVGKTEGRIYEILARRGRAPMCTNNCTTVPAPEVEAAIGMRPQTPSGVDVMSGRGPNGEVNPVYAGRGKLTGSAFREGPLAPGVSRLTVTASAGKALGFIRVGGAVLMIYGAYRTGERIANATPEELPTVVGEEAGSWVGGVIGSALGSAAGAAIFCLPAGPVDFICVAGGLVVGAALGAVGSTVGAEAGHSVVETVTNQVNEFGATLEYNIKRLYGVPF